MFVILKNVEIGRRILQGNTEEDAELHVRRGTTSQSLEWPTVWGINLRATDETIKSAFHNISTKANYHQSTKRMSHIFERKLRNYCY